MILVVGSTGLVGYEICRQLASKELPFRAMVRKTSDPKKVEQLQQLGAEIVYGDLKNPETLTKACMNTDVIIDTASSTLSHREGDNIRTVDEQGQLNMVRCASKNRVKQFIYLSFKHDPVNTFPLDEAKRHVEKELKTSGMNYTILSPSFFMEVWLTPNLVVDYEHYEAKIFGEGKGKMHWISYKDVAACSVASINNPKVMNKTIELGGPEGLTPLEVIKLFEQKTHHPFKINTIPRTALEQQRRSATDELQASLASLMLQTDIGDHINPEQAQQIFQIPWTRVSQYINTTISNKY
ncbi:MAG: hypothetical protein Kow00108_24170 [Calditrichia bacterium]